MFYNYLTKISENIDDITLEPVKWNVTMNL